MSLLERLRGGVFLVVPVAGLGLLAAAVLNGRGPGTTGPAPRPAPAAVLEPEPAASRAAPADPAAPPPAPAGKVSRAMDEARLRSTYENFRTAVATGDAALAEALRGALGRERPAALRIAREAVRRAPTPEDRAVSELALESLER